MSLLHIARDVLDHEIVDADGTPCGIVDDVEVEIDADGQMRVVALACGPGVMQAVLPKPLAALSRALFGKRRVRIPWSAVAGSNERVQLRVTAASLGLNAADRALARAISRIPGS